MIQAMIQTIISTVGTSLLVNLARLPEEHKLRQFHDAKNWPALVKELAKLDEFQPENILVVERHHGESSFRQLAPEVLTDWLEVYTPMETVKP